VRLCETREGEPHLEVRDTGVGIARKYLDHGFEPFTQEDRGHTRRFEGLGIGLPL
jgi:signal transduction histidine kinase